MYRRLAGLSSRPGRWSDPEGQGGVSPQRAPAHVKDRVDRVDRVGVLAVLGAPSVGSASCGRRSPAPGRSTGGAADLRGLRANAPGGSCGHAAAGSIVARGCRRVRPQGGHEVMSL